MCFASAFHERPQLPPARTASRSELHTLASRSVCLTSRRDAICDSGPIERSSKLRLRSCLKCFGASSCSSFFFGDLASSITFPKAASFDPRRSMNSPVDLREACDLVSASLLSASQEGVLELIKFFRVRILRPALLLYDTGNVNNVVSNTEVAAVASARGELRLRQASTLV